MDWRVDDLRVYVEVVRAGSFAAAARALGLPRSSVSRRVASLEQEARVQLLWRNTRSMRPTEVGQEFFERSVDVLRGIDEARAVLEVAARTPRGRLRISAPPFFGPALLGPAVDEYLSAYPDVSVEVQIDTAVRDLRAQGYDLAIRIGAVVDEDLVAKRVGRMRPVLAAAPDYLDRVGRPEQPAALSDHSLLVFGDCDAIATRLRLLNGRREALVDTRAALRSNDHGLLLSQAIAGRGVAILPRAQSEDPTEGGALEIVLPQWRARSTPVHAVYAGGRLASGKLKRFVEILRRHVRSA